MIPTAAKRGFSCALLAAALAIAMPAVSARAERIFLPLDREGSWTGSDKALHFAGSFWMASALRVEGRNEGAAVAISFGVGVAKEVYDAAFKPARLGRGASRKDLVVDLLGAAAGVLVFSALD